MTRTPQIDVPLLFQLWQQPIPRREIALRLGVAASYIDVLQRLHKLPKTGRKIRPDGKLRVDPFLMTPEEFERRKAECRERHFAKRRSERAGLTRCG